MKKIYLTTSLLMLLPLLSFAQKQTDIYFTFGNEFLFQGATIKEGDNKMNNNMRFTAFFHVSPLVNFDFSRWSGIYTGLAIRNVGYIQDEVPDPDIDKIKRRSYTLGLPLAFKVGNMEKTFFFVGAEYEWLFHYKEKTFNGNVKSIYKDWFTNRTPHFMPSVFAGVQFPGGVNLKAKYYLTNFLNEDYTDSNGQHPFAGMDVRIFYVALSFNISTRMARDFADGSVFVER